MTILNIYFLAGSFYLLAPLLLGILCGIILKYTALRGRRRNEKG
jgi:hypothetical protein